MIPTDHTVPRSSAEAQPIARRAVDASALGGVLTTWRHVAGPHPRPRYALVETSNA